MRAVSGLASSTRTSSADLYFCVVAELKSGAEGVLRSFIDEVVRGKKFAARPFDLHIYKGDEVCLTKSQGDEVRIALRAGWQKHANRLLDALQKNKYQ